MSQVRGRKFRPPLKEPTTAAQGSSETPIPRSSALRDNSQVHTLLSFCEDTVWLPESDPPSAEPPSQQDAMINRKKKSYHYKYFKNQKKSFVSKSARNFTATSADSKNVNTGKALVNSLGGGEEGVYFFVPTPAPSQTNSRTVKRTKEQVLVGYY